jgi:phosphoglucomutase
MTNASLLSICEQAVAAGHLLPSAKDHISLLLAGSAQPLDQRVIAALVSAEDWSELNDRFYQTLSFGTGGLRGRTISRHPSPLEQGKNPADRCPEFPCVGTNAMNTFNVSRATQGLARYLLNWFRTEGRAGRPAVCLAHDTRYFSRDFAELAARVLADLGCDAWLFASHRSTPELSFAIRHLGAQAGINLTASHNPPPYNGYKVYFEDGGQIVEPHAAGIIQEVREVPGETYQACDEAHRGLIRVIGPEVDAAYLEKLKGLVMEPEVIAQARDLRLVYSALHGTGGVIIVPLLKAFGFQFSTVASQDVPDGGFPTVASPNPEVAPALDLALQQAEAEGADLVLATDPDADRMGAAARGPDGKMHLLTGNQIGSILAYHRLHRHFALGWLTEANRSRATLIKTFVTTELQTEIARSFGVRLVNTLTGFKYIGAKLRRYEEDLPNNLRQDYQNLSEAETRLLRLTHSTYFVFGGEESYGYSGADFVRDKDANSAVVMLAEAAAYARSEGLSLPELLDRIYLQYGYFAERGESLTLEGADGAQQIRRLVQSYQSQPPTEIAGRNIVATQDFSQPGLLDEEGEALPTESMLLFNLTDGYRVAVRPSGTEPKIKFYLFAAEGAGQGLSTEQLAAAKSRATTALEATWTWLQADVARRLGHA